MEQHNEQELLLLISKGDEVAFRKLFHFYKPVIYTSALRMAGDPALANDIYQDIFLRVWLKRTTLAGMENFGGWLFTVARNLMFDSLKRAGNKQTDKLDAIGDARPDTSYDPAGILQEKEVLAVLSEAVSRLPPKQRETYQLIKVEGLSRFETATRMKVSPETVKWNLDQAMRSIRAYCLKHLDFGLFLALLLSGL